MADKLTDVKNKVRIIQARSEYLIGDVTDPETRRALDIIHERLAVLEDETITELERKLK